jgi:hypothetical protein
MGADAVFHEGPRSEQLANNSGCADAPQIDMIGDRR